MSIAKEFREFAVKGNVMDLAVGVIIGAAFPGKTQYCHSRESGNPLLLEIPRLQHG